LEKQQKYYLLGLVILYFVLSFVGILHHEIWLDEAQHWLFARDSTSIQNLIYNLRYEGHPMLWNILLYFITRITQNPFWMQFLHIVISTIAIYIFLVKAPFSLIFKTLFIFGYFMFYEYNIISRNYMLGVLFLFLACSIYKNREKRYILLMLYLALATNTHLIFGIISFALFMTLLFDNFLKRNLKNKMILLGSLIFIIGLTLSIIQIIPPKDTTFFDHIDTLTIKEKIIPGFISFFKGLFPLPDFRTIHFWNTNLFVNISKPITAIVGIVVYFIPLYLFKKQKLTLFFIYTALMGVQIFFFITQLSATRYFGMTFIIFMVALWLNKYHSNYTEVANDKLKNYIVYGILIIQFIASIIAFSIDFVQPFSAGKEVTTLLKEKNLFNHKVITTYCEGTILSPYLKKKVYFLCGDSLQSYCLWHIYTACDFTNQDIINKLSRLVSDKSMIFICNSDLFKKATLNNWYNVNNRLSVKLISKLGKHVVKNLSGYSVFEIKVNSIN